jgi:site-specific DNA recombinase
MLCSAHLAVEVGFAMAAKRTRASASLPRVAVYTRVSSAEQARDGVSLEMQLQKALEWCNLRYDKGRYEYRLFQDDGFPGNWGVASAGGKQSKTRPHLTDLVQAMEAGDVDLVVVYRLDRLSRSPKLTFTLLEDYFKRLDVGLVSVTEAFDASTKEGRMLVGMLASVAAYYLDLLRENVADSIATRRQQGLYSGRTPYGWRYKLLREEDGKKIRGETLERVDEQAKWVEQIADWYLRGWGDAKIARRLNELGVRRFAGANRWSRASVSGVVNCPIHAGLVPTNGKMVRGQHYDQRIYDKETYDQLQEARKQRRTLGSRTAGAPRHLLRGIAFCGTCGRQLMMQFTASSVSYRCRGNENVGKTACRGTMKSARILEGWVIEQVRELAESEAFQQLSAEEAEKALAVDADDLGQERERLEKTLGKLNAQFEKWADALTTEAMTLAQFREYNSGLTEKQEKLRERLEEIEQTLAGQSSVEDELARVKDALRDFPRVWENLEDEEKRELLRLLVERVTVRGKGRKKQVELRLYFMEPIRATV